MDKRINFFTERELNLRKMRKTTFYQTVVPNVLKTIMINKRIGITRACNYIGENWGRIHNHVGSSNKLELLEISKEYGTRIKLSSKKS